MDTDGTNKPVTERRWLPVQISWGWSPRLSIHPTVVTAMASMIAYDVYDVVLVPNHWRGCPQRRHALVQIRGHRLLTAFQNAFTGAKLSEYHTGFRAFSKDFS